MSTPDRAHQHNNPSPSLGVGAWCNGRPGDPGCGQFVPLDSFTPERAAYFDPYLVDRRTLNPEMDNHHNAAVCPYCTHNGAWKLVETARLAAVMRLLVNSGDMTPTAVRQINVSLGIESATVDL